MARLVLTHKGAVLKEVALDKERVTIGRKPHNDIQLDDQTVSGEHAVILNLQNVYVEDLGSTNGTLLNGNKVNKRQLAHGDVIRIGHHEIKFMDDAVQSFDATVVIAPEPAAPAAEAAQQAPVVKIMNGPRAGQKLELSKPYTTLGAPGVQVAVIARRGTSYYLMPMGGVGDRSNPPRLNDEPLGTESKPLKEGDVIEVAGSKLQFTSAE